MSIEKAIRILSEEIQLREEFERRRAIRMGLDPKKVLSDRTNSDPKPEHSRVTVGST
jgi:hypothetical protein